MIRMNNNNGINLSNIEEIDIITETKYANGEPRREPYVYTKIRYVSGTVVTYKPEVGRAILKQFPVFKWWKLGKEE